MYGAQACPVSSTPLVRFENDVEMYGAQAEEFCERTGFGLRMM